MPLASINPTTGNFLKSYKSISSSELEEKLASSQKAFLSWKQESFSERAKHIRAVAEVLRLKKSQWAEQMTLEMGKPITEAQAEIEKCAWTLDYFAEHAEAFLKDQSKTSEASRSYIHYAPLGVILGIMPWNFPFWQVMRFAAPNLMAGNAIVIKHASNVPGCALAIEQVFRDAHFPEHVFQALLIQTPFVKNVIAHPAIKAISLTGSSGAGKEVAAESGRHLKKCVLELGGSDPFIVLGVKNIEACAAQAVQARLLNTGQSCIAAKRFIVLDNQADEFEAAYVKAMQAKIIGDPMNEKTQIGPLARADLRDALHEQVQKSVAKGARVLLGGHPLDGPGAFYAPTVLTDVKKGMPAYDEEFFGPVASIIRVKSIEEAIKVANDTPYGLGGSVWADDVELAEKVALQIEAGMVFVNGIVKSDPRLPFGGIKESGYGRELSDVGIREFVNIQTICVAS